MFAIVFFCSFSLVESVIFLFYDTGYGGFNVLQYVVWRAFANSNECNFCVYFPILSVFDHLSVIAIKVYSTVDSICLLLEVVVLFLYNMETVALKLKCIII